jgi:hypothetical protein
MIRENFSPREYLQFLQARIPSLRAFRKGRDWDLEIPAVPIQTKGKVSWMAGRGSAVSEELIEKYPDSKTPLALRKEGLVELFFRMESLRNGLKVVSYRLAVIDLPDNPYGLRSFRYDWGQGASRGDGWDRELADNPQHPMAHLHINFLSADDRDCRLPTAPVCPVLFLCALDHWYCSTFKIR